MNGETRTTLLSTNTYWYEVSPVGTKTGVGPTLFDVRLVQTGEADLGRPFLNKAIIDILKEQYFDGRKSLYRLFPQEFKQGLATEDGGKGFEIPPRLIALVATFVGRRPISMNLVANGLFRSIVLSLRVTNLPRVGSTRNSARSMKGTSSS